MDTPPVDVPTQSPVAHAKDATGHVAKHAKKIPTWALIAGAVAAVLLVGLYLRKGTTNAKDAKDESTEPDTTDPTETDTTGESERESGGREPVGEAYGDPTDLGADPLPPAPTPAGPQVDIQQAPPNVTFSTEPGYADNVIGGPLDNGTNGTGGGAPARPHPAAKMHPKHAKKHHANNGAAGHAPKPATHHAPRPPAHRAAPAPRPPARPPARRRGR